MKPFIVIEGKLCMFQVPLRYPRVFFSRISFPLDQEHAGHQSAMMVENFFNFIFFFFFNKVRQWSWEVWAMYTVLIIE